MGGCKMLLVLLAAFCAVEARRSISRKGEHGMGTEQQPEFFVFVEVYDIGTTPWADYAEEEEPSFIHTSGGDKHASQQNRSDSLVHESEKYLVNFYHSELVVCPRAGFSEDEQARLVYELSQNQNCKWYQYWCHEGFVELERAWWEAQSASCQKVYLMGPAFRDRTEPCSGLVHTEHMLSVANTSVSTSVFEAPSPWKYFYGTTDLSMEDMLDDMCGQEACGLRWAGFAYNAVLANCNNFVTTCLDCMLGLNPNLDNLHLSEGGTEPACHDCQRTAA